MSHREFILLLPGPVSLSPGVKAAMMVEHSPWGEEFMRTTRKMEDDLLEIAGVEKEKRGEYRVVFYQGCGSFMLEILCNTLVPKEGGKLLVLNNGIYGQRVIDCARRVGCAIEVIEVALWEETTSKEVERRLLLDEDITHVWAVHCETSTGISNPVDEIAEVVRAQGRRLIVDSIASFGCEEQKIVSWGADVICATSNKCLEGPPGFSFACVHHKTLVASQGNACSYSMDLYEQWKVYEDTGKWRYTPPVHVVMGLAKSLEEFWEEGGATQRRARYRENMEALLDGMAGLGFYSMIERGSQSSVIATFFEPGDRNFDRKLFERELKESGFEIFPGWLTHDIPTIRIATIGAKVTKEVIEEFIEVVSGVLKRMGVKDGSPLSGYLEMLKAD